MCDLPCRMKLIGCGPVRVQGESSATLRLTRIEAGTDGGGSCPLFVAGYDAWDDLSLEYRVPWPVQLLLTPPARPPSQPFLQLSEALDDAATCHDLQLTSGHSAAASCLEFRSGMNPPPL